MRLIELIDGAEQTLRMLYYTFLADAAGERVKQALLRAVDRGVAVSLLVDGFGSSATPDGYFAELANSSAKFCRFNPSYGRRYLLRNHQKLALADGREGGGRAMIGGFNIVRRLFRRQRGRRVARHRADRRRPGGGAAGALLRQIDGLGPVATSRSCGPWALWFASTARAAARSNGNWAARRRGSARGASRPAGTCVHSRDVEIIAAYFAPTWGLLKRIARVGNRGRARVITAAKSDNTATIAAARFTYNRLIKRGVEVYEYVPTKLHTKLVLLDDVVHIGSANLDIRSLYLNMELMLRVDDRRFAAAMRRYFESELEQSLAITPQLQKKRATWLNRARWALSFFLVTSLDYGVTRRLNFGLTAE